MSHTPAATGTMLLQDFATPLDADYRPRFCIETGGIDMTVTAANDDAVRCELGIYRLECAEHLPVSGSDAAPAAATLAEVSTHCLSIQANTHTMHCKRYRACM